MARVANECVRPLDVHLVIYLVDYEQRTLRALPDDGAPAPPSAVDGSLPGRAFSTVTVQASDRTPARLWIPILDGTTRLGVLEAELPDKFNVDDVAVRDGCLGIASLLGHVVQAKNALGDTVQVTRRSQPMTVASELLWTIVPPTTFACEQLVLSAVLEPCYDAGGDGFDYSVDGSLAHVAVLDARGHGLSAGLTGCLALSTLRAARRQGADLPAMAQAADTEIADQWNDARFATALLAQLDLESGVIRYVNAGHPPAALIRGGRVVRLLDRGRRMPLGLAGNTPEPAEESLEPGDRLLVYTDGVTEARDEDGKLFGLDRLVELTERHVASGLPTAEILRRLSHAVLEYQNGVLQDDATLLLAEWSPAASARTQPSDHLLPT
jgi:serine phosphatase RsbU (regulator of sigma subunit)